jgi:hypothetical protein
MTAELSGDMDTCLMASAPIICCWLLDRSKRSPSVPSAALRAAAAESLPAVAALADHAGDANMMAFVMRDDTKASRACSSGRHMQGGLQLDLLRNMWSPGRHPHPTGLHRPPPRSAPQRRRRPPRPRPPCCKLTTATSTHVNTNAAGRAAAARSPPGR